MVDNRFFGYPVKSVRVEGLRAEIIEEYGYVKLILKDTIGTKWEIRIVETGTFDSPGSLSLYHRDHDPTQPRRLHYQKISAVAAYAGVQKLLACIASHERYERRKNRIQRLARTDRREG